MLQSKVEKRVEKLEVNPKVQEILLTNDGSNGLHYLKFLISSNRI